MFSFLIFIFLFDFVNCHNVNFTEPELERHKRSCACVSQYTPVNCKCHQSPNATELLCRCEKAQLSPQCSCAPSASTICSPVCQQQCVQACLAQQQPLDGCQNTCQSTCSHACQQLQPPSPGFSSSVVYSVPPGVQVPQYTVPPMPLPQPILLSTPSTCHCAPDQPNCQCNCVPHCTEQCVRNCPASQLQCSQTCSSSCESACLKHHTIDEPILYSDCSTKCLPSCRKACVRPHESALNGVACQDACVGMCQTNCQLSSYNNIIKDEPMQSPASSTSSVCAPSCMPVCDSRCLSRFMEQFSEPIPLNPPRWRKNSNPSSGENINKNEIRGKLMTTTVTTASEASPEELTTIRKTTEPRENLLAPLMDEPEPNPIAPLFHQVQFKPQESTVVQNVPLQPQNQGEHDPNRQGRQLLPQENQEFRYPIQAYQRVFSYLPPSTAPPSYFPPHQSHPSHPVRRPLLAPTNYQPNNRSRIEPKIYQQLYTDPQFGPTLALNIQFPTPTKGCAPGCQPQCTVQCIERDMDGITVTATEARSFFKRRFSKQGINRQVKSNQIMFTNPKAVDPDEIKIILEPLNDVLHSPMIDCVPECTRVCKRECLKQNSGVFQCYRQCNQECMARCPERTD